MSRYTLDSNRTIYRDEQTLNTQKLFVLLDIDTLNSGTRIATVVAHGTECETTIAREALIQAFGNKSLKQRLMALGLPPIDNETGETFAEIDLSSLTPDPKDEVGALNYMLETSFSSLTLKLAESAIDGGEETAEAVIQEMNLIQAEPDPSEYENFL